jgi:hypothetical protein
MANPDVARGLIPTRTIQGVPYSGQVQTFLATGATGAIYIGSPVKHGGTSALFNGWRYPTVAGGFSTGNTIVGVCVGIEAVTRESTTYRATSTDRLIHVCTDPFMLFEVQDSQGADADAVVAAEIGHVADLSSDGGSTVTGRSSIELDGSTATNIAGSDQTEDVQIIEVIRRPDNELGGNAAYLVRMLNHYFTTDDAAD